MAFGEDYQMDYTLKLLICYHKEYALLKDDILTPIHVGRALARRNMGGDSPQFKWLEENMMGDDTGENISDKNSSYNELTAVYWAWKNYDKLGNPDYIGLMHYRRHFIFRESPDVVEEVCGIDGNYFNRINYSSETIAHLFDDCDFVAHIGHVDEVYKHYRENHHIEDLDLAIEILKKKYPEYSSTADAYLHMSYVNLCNMFIMPRKMFFKYCGWLFGILEEFDRRVDLSEKRLFISERLTGIFIEHQRRKGFRQKSLPATLVMDDINVPVIMSYKGNVFRMAVTMLSMLYNAELTTHIDFYILHNGELSGSEFDHFLRRYQGHTIKYINVSEKVNELGIVWPQIAFSEQDLFVIARLFDQLKKVLYIDERAYFFGDVARLYNACNNDEFTVIGIPSENNNQLFGGNIFSINLPRLRKIISNKPATLLSDIKEFFVEQAFSGQIAHFPDWTYFVTNMADDCEVFYEKARIESSGGRWGRVFMYFTKNTEPWKEVAAIYSMYWWKTACRLPSSFSISEAEIETLAKLKQHSTEAAKKWHDFETNIAYYSNTCQSRGVIERTVTYLKLHGVKQTVKKIFSKIAGK